MYYTTNNEAKQKYLAKFDSKLVLFFGRNNEILKAVLACFHTDKSSYHVPDNKLNELHKLLWQADTKHISSIFSAGEFKVLVKLLGKEWAEKFKKIWDRSLDYIYSTGYDRRSFRTKSFEVLYLSSNVRKLDCMINLVANDFTYERYFTQKDNVFANNPLIADLLALEIDEGNEAVLNWIKDIVFGDNNTGLITHEIIKGLLMSHSSQAHKWVGDLLLAAKLQEGLRQTIVEKMDEGSKEGFLYILKIILDHDLARFSSVVRALDVWTGLGIAAQKPAVIKKCLETAYRCLTEEAYIDECLTSSDALHIFMGLWALAFEEVGSIESWLKHLVSAPEKYKRMVALYFLRQTKSPLLQHGLAAPLLDDPEEEVKCWVLGNLFPDVGLRSLSPEYKGGLVKYNKIESIVSREQLFDKLKNMLDNLPRKGLVFSESLFPWCQIGASSDDIIGKMLLTLAEAPDDKVDLMLDYRDKMSPDTRREFIHAFLKPPHTKKQKKAIVELMGDKSSYVRTSALKIVEELELAQDDYQIIEDLLQYKSGDLRKNAISVLLRRPPQDLLGSIQRLVDDKNEHKHLAALDMIAGVENDTNYEKILPECRQMAVLLADTSQKTRVLAEKITNSDKPVYTAANGFGLYNPTQEITQAEIRCSEGFSARDIVTSNYEEIEQILFALNDLIDQHKDYEYEVEDWNGSKTKVVLGGQYNIRSIKYCVNRAFTIDDYPLPEVWREAAIQNNLTAQKLLALLFHYHLRNSFQQKKQEWYENLMADLFAINHHKIETIYKKLPYLGHVRSILSALLNEHAQEEVFPLCREMAAYIYQETPVHLFAEDYEKRNNEGSYYYVRNSSCLVNAKEISFWHQNLSSNIHNDQSFREGFQIRYALYKASGYKSQASLQLAEFEKAFTLGLVDENELYAEFCGRPLSPENLNSLTNSKRHGHKDLADCPKLSEVGQKVIDRVVGIELKRGDMTTEVSPLAAKINRCSGTRFFVDILVGAEKDTYVRGYNSVGGNSTKKEIFSHLLRCLYPEDGEDENTLRELLKDVKVTEKQLIDAAMYAPQWLDIVEKYLDWPGLKSACWYFHAHINETFSAEKETIVARYSPVSPQDFKDGAFDIAWFKEAYATLGEKRFKIVYDSAKYIAGGGQHKRAQLFADAVLGRIDVVSAEKIIGEKRNKDYVLCYGLIPLSSDKIELLNRYELLQAFLKESKQFGAQRRESESKVVSIALENLARNAGFQDVTRFMWSMETEKIKSIAKYLKPVSVEDIELKINIDELGRASVGAVKGGKVLKDVPAKLKNNEYVKEIKTVQKSLKDQYARARVSLEKAMEAGDKFTAGELQNLAQNPVLYPLLQNLVFQSGHKLGFFRNNALVDTQNQSNNLRLQDECLIAHPVHLYASKEWAAYQKDIYNRRIVQPFKQVFRELYKPNSDELEVRTISHRYDGHQIQPKKTVALLRGRGWTASYEEGLQKVYYKENIIVQIYALADWFSPAEVETPTIEGIAFWDRKTGKGLPITDIPELIFSEIMRDVDLVVSVAHVGGVDPEASLSTVEMRTVIVAEMLRLLKLTNVELKGSHAFIKGTLGQYTVHLGSAVVHKMASGAVHILPVHSQHRGRIFLPFIDDDPKTAEIISKIVFLAEDSKIKDPNILLQIVN